jgi:hypothetical protein
MEDNLNYGKKPVDFNNLAIPALDHMDGLRIKPLGKIIVPSVPWLLLTLLSSSDPDEDFELESVSDDEEDLIIDDEGDDSFQPTGLRFGAAPPRKAGKGMIGRIVKEQAMEHDNTRETVMEVSFQDCPSVTSSLIRTSIYI